MSTVTISPPRKMLAKRSIAPMPDAEIRLSAPKNAALDLLRLLPDNVDWPEIFYRLNVRLQIEDGLKEIEQGLGIPFETFKAKYTKWLSM